MQIVATDGGFFGGYICSLQFICSQSEIGVAN